MSEDKPGGGLWRTDADATPSLFRPFRPWNLEEIQSVGFPGLADSATVTGQYAQKCIFVTVRLREIRIRGQRVPSRNLLEQEEHGPQRRVFAGDGRPLLFPRKAKNTQRTPFCISQLTPLCLRDGAPP